MKKAFLIPAALLISLTACGKNIDGTYRSEAGLQYKFSGGKVTISGGGFASEADYSVDGDEIKIDVGLGPKMIVKILPDGSIDGPVGPMKKIN